MLMANHFMCASFRLEELDPNQPFFSAAYSFWRWNHQISGQKKLEFFLHHIST
jgi:hypothetical protein